MTHGWGRSAFIGVLFAAVLCGVAGCAAAEPDGVLWRQIAAFKDPLGTALVSARATDAAEFASAVTTETSALPGRYWDGKENPENLGLRDGALVLSSVLVNGQTLTFDVVISSGPRDVEADEFGDPRPYFGPHSIYTCFSASIEFVLGQSSMMGYNDIDCDPLLIAPLDDGARLHQVNEFNG